MLNQINKSLILFFRIAMAAYKEKMSFDAKCAKLKDMIWELQCFSCKSVPSPFGSGRNRYICDWNGHSLCEDCKYQCRCGSSVTRTPSKLIFKLLKDLPWFCGHYPFGCREILQKQRLENHERNCIYKPVFCPYLDCAQKMAFCQLSNHIKKQCKRNFRKAENEGGSYSDYYCTYIKARFSHQEFFWDVMKLTTRSGNVFYEITKETPKVLMMWIQFHGLDDELSNYEYSIVSNNGRKRFSFSSEVLPMTEDPDTISNKYPVLMLTKEAIKRMADKDNDFCYRVEIRNLKEEAKDDDVESGVSDISD